LESVFLKSVFQIDFIFLIIYGITNYYETYNIKTLREGMFAGKYFDKDAGTFKLVFYPAMGQTEPSK
jgi:hypothetical protein